MFSRGFNLCLACEGAAEIGAAEQVVGGRSPALSRCNAAVKSNGSFNN